MAFRTVTFPDRPDDGDPTLARWGECAGDAPTGRTGDLDLPMRRIALRTLVEDVPRPDRDVWESRILLDHLSESIATTFDPEGDAVSPAAVEDEAISSSTPRAGRPGWRRCCGSSACACLSSVSTTARGRGRNSRPS